VWFTGDYIVVFPAVVNPNALNCQTKLEMSPNALNIAGISGDTACGAEEMYFQEELNTASSNLSAIAEP
jgi:hypothetical protein